MIININIFVKNVIINVNLTVNGKNTVKRLYIKREKKR